MYVVEARPGVEIRQYSLPVILAVWAAAALPMAALAWLVAPRLAPAFTGPAPLSQSVIVCLTAGLVWQCALALALVGTEQGTLRWSKLREALWLRAPQSPTSGKRGGRLWLVLVPLVTAFAAAELLPFPPFPASRDLSLFMNSDGGHTLLAGSWTWFAVIAALVVFNTVLGEELLFRGVLLPRMAGVFGRADWVANGILFALYHLHMPWLIPGALTDTLVLSYPSRRYRSAWLGIVVHSAQSVVILVLLCTVVFR